MIDLTTKQGKHAEQRLRSDLIAWLTTVGSDGRPYTSAVWFLWENETILIFSQPKKQKVANLRKNPNVTVALDGTDEGGDVVVVEGTAELLNDPAISAATVSAYKAKYGKQLQDMNWTPEAMAADYSQAIRVTPKRLRTAG